MAILINMFVTYTKKLCNFFFFWGGEEEGIDFWKARREKGIEGRDDDFHQELVDWPV